jgi:hypothetical protein
MFDGRRSRSRTGVILPGNFDERAVGLTICAQKSEKVSRASSVKPSGGKLNEPRRSDGAKNFVRPVICENNRIGIANTVLKI